MIGILEFTQKRSRYTNTMTKSNPEIKNRSAYHEYFIDTKYEAGMVLLGTEVKSIRNGKVSFNDSYCLIDKGEMWIKSLHPLPNILMAISITMRPLRGS